MSAGRGIGVGRRVRRRGRPAPGGPDRDAARSATQLLQDPAGTAQLDPPDDSQGGGRHFWLAHMRIGFMIFLLEAAAVLVYLGLTPLGGHRKLLVAMVGGWLMLAAANLVVAPVVARRSWRTTFSVGWTVLCAFAVVGVADLDGGLRSPLAILLFLPIGYAGWAFSPVAAALCGSSSLVALGLVLATTNLSASMVHTAVVLGAVLAGASAMSVAAAGNRSRRERYEAELLERIAELAVTDGLTGCAVKRVFSRRLADEVKRAQRHGQPLSLVMIDVDHFKAVNDNFGHVVGDHVLAGVGAGLRFHARASDVVARLGGDEFAVLLPETGTAGAVEFGSRLLSELPRHLEVPVTLSMGVAALGGDGSAEQLVDGADFALYEAKRSGRGRLAVRSPEPSPRKPAVVAGTPDAPAGMPGTVTG